MSPKELSDIRRKLRVLQHGKETGNIPKTCCYFGICRKTYYQWKRDYDAKDEQALIIVNLAPKTQSCVSQPT